MVHTPLNKAELLFVLEFKKTFAQANTLD